MATGLFNPWANNSSVMSEVADFLHAENVDIMTDPASKKKKLRFIAIAICFQIQRPLFFFSSLYFLSLPVLLSDAMNSSKKAKLASEKKVRAACHAAHFERSPSQFEGIESGVHDFISLSTGTRTMSVIKRTPMSNTRDITP
jgi:hypothetical protein